MKRIIALVLSLVMVLSLCAPAWATMPSEGGALAASEITLKGTGSETDPYVVSTAAELKEAVAKGGNVKLGTNITLTVDTHKMTETSVCQMVENVVTIDLNGNNITSPDVVFYVLADGKLTINGSGNVTSGNGGSGQAVNVYAYGGEVVINGGTYTINKAYPNAAANHGADMIYANSGGKITINGGYFNYVENVWTLNLKDNTGSSIVVKGGTFKDFNPAKNVSEGANTNFVAEGYQVTESNNEYVVSKIPAVAKVDGTEYTDLQEALNVGGEVTLLDNVALDKAVTLSKNVILDLAGYEISGTDTTPAYDALVHVNNGAKLTVMDSSTTGTGKITYTANGNGIQGATILVEGDLVLKSGTIALNGSWSLGFAVDVRPNAWGTAYTAPTTFVMENGKVLATDTAVRVASNSSDKHKPLGVSFTMMDGEIDSGWDAILIHHLYKNTLNITVNKGVVSGEKSALRILGDVKSDVNVSVFDGDFTGDLKNLEAKGQGNITINGGYFTVDPSDYCADKLTGVTSDKSGYLYMVGDEIVDDPAEIVVADPEVTVNTAGMSETEKKIANDIKNAEDAVKLDERALTAVATNVAKETSTEETLKEHKNLINEELDADTADGDVITIVVQPYFDIEIKDVVVEETGEGTEAAVASATIVLDITPKYQTVATTANDLNDIDLEGDGKNAVVIPGAGGKLTVTEPVVITIKIPAALVALATDNKLFVTHEASSGTYVYEAKVEGSADDGYTATFTNPHGFSSFSIGATDNTAAEVKGGDKYTNLKDAINNAGKNAEITVKAPDQIATVRGEMTFTLKFEDPATKENTKITAGAGYYLTTKDVNGGVEYTVKAYTYSGGWYPSTNEPIVESPDTFDAGIALYVAVSVMGAIGTVALGKKRED